MQRIVENEHCVDIEEKVNGIWAVVRCSLSVKTPQKPREKGHISYYKRNKQEILKKQREANKRKFPLRISGTGQYSKYGMTEKDYNDMKERQGGKCFLCGSKPKDGKVKKLLVDHNHKNGKVRALLCNKCNVGIGLLQDDPVFMMKVVEYLVSHE